MKGELSKIPAYAFSIIGLLLLLVGVGVYFESYDVFASPLFNGSITGEPLKDYANLAFIGLINIFYVLYTHYPATEWMDVFRVGLIIICGAWYLRLLNVLLVRAGAGKWMVAAVMLVAPVLFYRCVVEFNSTMFTFFLGPFSLLEIILLPKTGKKHYPLYALLCLALLFGALIRIESTIIALSGVVALLLLKHRLAQANYLYLSLPFVIILGVALYVFADRYYSSDFVKTTDLTQYLVSDAHDIVATEALTTARDSMLFEAMGNLWLSDTANLDLAFLAKLRQYKIGLSAAYFKNVFPIYAANTLHDTLGYILSYLPWVVFLLWVSVVAWLLTRRQQSRGKFSAFPFLFLPLTFLAIIMVLRYLVKMEPYVFLPLILVWPFYLLAAVPAVDEEHRSKSNVALMLLLLGIGGWALSSVLETAAFRKAQREAIAEVRAELENKSQGKILMIDVTSNILYNSAPFNTPILKSPRQILLYDNGQLVLGQQYTQYHNRACNCNALNNKEFYTYLQQHHTDVLFVSNEWRMDFVSRYLRQMHGVEMPVFAADKTPALKKLEDYGIDLNYFTWP